MTGLRWTALKAAAKVAAAGGMVRVAGSHGGKQAGDAHAPAWVSRRVADTLIRHGLAQEGEGWGTVVITQAGKLAAAAWAERPPLKRQRKPTARKSRARPKASRPLEILDWIEGRRHGTD